MSRRAMALAAGLILSSSAGAEEWHDAYHAGLAALARKDPAQAVAALRRAVALRPEPGRNVVTYGTNIEPRYFPYLALAEAHLALGQLDAARQALATSATWQREPAAEREKLWQRLAAAEPTPAPPPSAAALPAPPTTAPAATPPEATPPVTPKPETTAPAAPSPAPPPVRAARPSPRGTEPPPPVPSPNSPAPSAEAGTSVIEVVSDPPGAAVYIDDEPVGSTDPATGRLLKTGLAAERHRVRLAHPGHADAIQDIAVSPGGRVALHVALTPTGEAPVGYRGGFVALAAVAIALIGLLGWMAFSTPKTPGPIWAPTPRPPTATAGELTPRSLTPRQVSPGSRVDAAGREWFGDFELLELVGRGGMASVFKAVRRGETLALKRPLASFLDDPEFVSRFSREAEIGRSLNHPNIVRILERGALEAVPYFTMEFLAGETLQALVRSRGPLPPREAATIVAQVSEALDFAHTKGVVHRDLKPSNIMRLPDATAKVMDFGIAHALRFDGLTATGAFLGTPDYVAPEMIEGRGAEPRSDLYALGVILFELLTGTRPFPGDTPFAILQKHCSEPPPAPSRIRSGVPAELDAIVLGLMSKSPAGRPPSAEALVLALRDWLNQAA